MLFRSVLDAAVKAGAPEGIIGWIDEPSVELSQNVMRESDIILATGGPAMVKAAYSSAFTSFKNSYYDLPLFSYFYP